MDIVDFVERNGVVKKERFSTAEVVGEVKLAALIEHQTHAHAFEVGIENSVVMPTAWAFGDHGAQDVVNGGVDWHRRPAVGVALVFCRCATKAVGPKQSAALARVGEVFVRRVVRHQLDAALAREVAQARVERQHRQTFGRAVGVELLQIVLDVSLDDGVHRSASVVLAARTSALTASATVGRSG